MPGDGFIINSMEMDWRMRRSQPFEEDLLNFGKKEEWDTLFTAMRSLQQQATLIAKGILQLLRDCGFLPSRLSSGKKQSMLRQLMEILNQEYCKMVENMKSTVCPMMKKGPAKEPKVKRLQQARSV